MNILFLFQVRLDLSILAIKLSNDQIISVQIHTPMCIRRANITSKREPNILTKIVALLIEFLHFLLN